MRLVGYRLPSEEPKNQTPSRTHWQPCVRPPKALILTTQATTSSAACDASSLIWAVGAVVKPTPPMQHHTVGGGGGFPFEVGESGFYVSLKEYAATRK